MAKKRATAPELTQATYIVARYKTTRWAVYRRDNGIDTRVSAPQPSKRDAIAAMIQYTGRAGLRSREDSRAEE